MLAPVGRRLVGLPGVEVAVNLCARLRPEYEKHAFTRAITVGRFFKQFMRMISSTDTGNIL
ncbi:MAG: hypothetical protein ABIS36_14105, partial [Chryseolinea sp.]